MAAQNYSKEEQKLKKIAENSVRMKKVFEVLRKSKVAKTRIYALERLYGRAEGYNDEKAAQLLLEAAQSAPCAADRCQAALYLGDKKLTRKLLVESIGAAFEDPDVIGVYTGRFYYDKYNYDVWTWLDRAGLEGYYAIASNERVSAPIRIDIILEKIPSVRRVELLKTAVFSDADKSKIAASIPSREILEEMAHDPNTDPEVRAQIIAEHLSTEDGADILSNGSMTKDGRLLLAKKISDQKTLEEFASDPQEEASVRFDIVCRHLAPERKAKFIDDSGFSFTQKCQIAVGIWDNKQRKQLLEQYLPKALLECCENGDETDWIGEIKSDDILFYACDRLDKEIPKRNLLVFKLMNRVDDETRPRFAKYLLKRGYDIKKISIEDLRANIDSLTQKQLKDICQREIDRTPARCFWNNKTFDEFVAKITDNNILGDLLLDNCREGGVCIRKNLDFFYDRLKDRRDILTKLLLKTRKEAYFNDSTLFNMISSDPECLVEVACSALSPYNKKAAELLSPEVLAQIVDRAADDTVRDLSKLAAMELKLPAASEAELLAVLKDAVRIPNSQKIVEKAAAGLVSDDAISDALLFFADGGSPCYCDTKQVEADLFSRLTDKDKILSIFLGHLAYFGNMIMEKIVGLIGYKLRGTAQGDALEKELETILRKSMTAPDSLPLHTDGYGLSRAIDVLSWYDGCSYAEAVWKHGKTEYVAYLISKLRYCSEKGTAKRYEEILSGIYRMGGAAENAAKSVNGESMSLHNDWTSSTCGSDHDDYQTAFTVKL